MSFCLDATSKVRKLIKNNPNFRSGCEVFTCRAHFSLRHLHQWVFLPQTVPLKAFFQTKQWLFFLSSSFSLFFIFLFCRLTESSLRDIFHTVPVHSNEPIVSENMQASRSGPSGTSEGPGQSRSPPRARKMWRVKYFACQAAPTRVRHAFAAGTLNSKGLSRALCQSEI